MTKLHVMAYRIREKARDGLLYNKAHWNAYENVTYDEFIIPNRAKYRKEWKGKVAINAPKYLRQQGR